MVVSLAMVSNVAFAMRSIFKRNLSKEYKVGESLVCVFWLNVCIVFE